MMAMVQKWICCYFFLLAFELLSAYCALCVPTSEHIIKSTCKPHYVNISIKIEKIKRTYSNVEWLMHVRTNTSYAIIKIKTWTFNFLCSIQFFATFDFFFFRIKSKLLFQFSEHTSTSPYENSNSKKKKTPRTWQALFAFKHSAWSHSSSTPKINK